MGSYAQVHIDNAGVYITLSEDPTQERVLEAIGEAIVTYRSNAFANANLMAGLIFIELHKITTQKYASALAIGSHLVNCDFLVTVDMTLKMVRLLTLPTWPKSRLQECELQKVTAECTFDELVKKGVMALERLSVVA